MKKIINIYFIFEIIFTLAFLTIFVGTFFNRVSVHTEVNNLYSIISIVFIFCMWIFIYKKVLKNAKNWSIKKEIIISIITFVIFCVLQFIAGIFLKVKLGWDFGVIFGNAKSFVLYGDRLQEGYYPNYFQYFPNNIFIFVIYVIVIKLGYILHIVNFIDPEIILIIFNIFTVDFAIIILYFCLRKMFDKKQAYFGLLLCLFFSPLILYSTIYYSDTLSLPFPILLLYLYLLVKDDEKCKKNYIFIFLMGIGVFVGIKIKMTVIIMYIAILFDMILKNKYPLFFKTLLINSVIIIVMSVLFNHLIVNNEKFHFQTDDFGKVPYTHWIMMGIQDPDFKGVNSSAIGGYSLADYEKTWANKNTDEAKAFNKRVIKDRIKRYGFLGYAKYLLKKADNAWGDGTYFVSVKLGVDSERKNETLYSIFVVNQKNYNYYLYFAQGVQLVFLILMIANSIKVIINKKFENSYVRVAVFGLMLFMLLWENRSRYLLNFIPIFIVQIIEFFYTNDNIKYKFSNQKLLRSKNG